MTIHEKDVRNHKCESCGLSFHKPNQLKRHISVVHLKEETFQCKSCENQFNSLHYLKRHMKEVHENVKKHKCNICGRYFTYPRDVRNHIKKTHEKIKDYKCNCCEKTYSDKSHLKRHFISVHEEKRCNENNMKIETQENTNENVEPYNFDTNLSKLEISNTKSIVKIELSEDYFKSQFK